jgi:hypothetical protein
VATVSPTPNVPGSGFRGIPFPQQATKGTDSSSRKPRCRPSSPSLHQSTDSGSSGHAGISTKTDPSSLLLSARPLKARGWTATGHRQSSCRLAWRSPSKRISLKVGSPHDQREEAGGRQRPLHSRRWRPSQVDFPDLVRVSSTRCSRSFRKVTTGRPGNYGSPASHPSTQLPLCTMAHGYQATAPHPRSNNALAQHTLARDAWSVKGSSTTRRRTTARCEATELPAWPPGQPPHLARGA